MIYTLDENSRKTGLAQARGILARIDWKLLLYALPITIAGLVTMQSYDGGSMLFYRQVAWLGVSLLVFFALAFLDTSVLKKTSVIVGIFLSFILMLVLVLFIGRTANGAQSWFAIGPFSMQPSDFAKLALILILAKYFTRRHVAIGQINHLFISGAYMVIPFALILLQPDFGTTIILGLIWLGMAIVAGIRKRHLALLFGAAAIGFVILWSFVFAPYQKARITSFISPLSDIHGAGYNARQAVIAVGSGEVFGKGVGYGTQSRLRFLPEYQTDFIFAAFAEEWGFVGAILLLILFGLLIARILAISIHGESNFETLFCAGVAIMFVAHITINVGMNMGILPVTGITLPFMSYGGSHLIMEFAALGILSSMSRNTRKAHPEDLTREFEGL